MVLNSHAAAFLGAEVVLAASRGLRAVGRAACKHPSTAQLLLYMQSYFPYVGLDPSKDLFKYLDVLVWLEASIYQLDEENEALARTGQHAHGRNLLRE